MPTITPQARASIGGSEPQGTQQRRVTVTASTGMTAPISKAANATTNAPTSSQAPGQNGKDEETAAPAVTLSPQLTALARKQQKLQLEIQSHREQLAQWEKQKADFVPKTELAKKFESDALGALKDLGMTYEQFNERLLAQLNGADPVSELRSEINQLKKSQEESVNKQFDATLRQYRAEADALIAGDPKSFHLITKGKHQDAVVQHIVDTWEENPEDVLTVAQAAKEVEEVLRENARAAAEALKELEPVETEAQAQPQKKQLPPPKAAQPLRTLTNQVETTPQARSYGQFQHLSMKERIAQAIARAQR